MVLSCLPSVSHTRAHLSVSSTPSLPLHTSSPLAIRKTSMETPSPQGTLSYNDKAQGNFIPEMPSHWIFERDGHLPAHSYFCWSPFFHLLHHLLCVIGFGHGSLYHVWEVSHPDCPVEVWESGRDSLRERLQHINVMVCFQRRLDKRFIDFFCAVWSRLVCS